MLPYVFYHALSELALIKGLVTDQCPVLQTGRTLILQERRVPYFVQGVIANRWQSRHSRTRYLSEYFKMLERISKNSCYAICFYFYFLQIFIYHKRNFFFKIWKSYKDFKTIRAEPHSTPLCLPQCTGICSANQEYLAFGPAAPGLVGWGLVEISVHIHERPFSKMNFLKGRLWLMNPALR